MITELSISGLGVIDEAHFEPHSGFTAITGETGAGKTMVVTALGLITGGRGDAGRVRSGADRAVVEARLTVPPDDPALAGVAAAGGRLDEDGSIILVRTLRSDGRSRAHVGGRSAPVGTLADLTVPLVTIHGQSEAIGLLQPARQLAVLDRFAGTESVLAGYRAARTEWLDALSDLHDRTSHQRERALREQVLRGAVSEIDAVRPESGEDAELVAGVRRLENADALRAAADGARRQLAGDGDEPTALGQVDAARRSLLATGDPRLMAWSSELTPLTAVLVDVAAELSHYLGDLEVDPGRLDELLSRQAALRSLTRRFGPELDDVIAWRDRAAAELLTLDSSEEALATLRDRCHELGAVVADRGEALHERRAAAAAALARGVTAELSHLAMGRATFAAVLDWRTADHEHTVVIGEVRVAAGVDGVDAVEFRLAPHAGAADLPLARAASGGELARVMLAIEVVLAGADPVATLVFDEVDAGVGGRAATEIGRRLAGLARDHQVVVVTHLAQVAAFADRHIVVDDAGSARGVRAADLRVVDGREREHELARMLGGTSGATARSHAAELLQSAREMAHLSR